MYNYNYYLHSFVPCFENVPSLLYCLYKSCRIRSLGPLNGGPDVLCLSTLRNRQADGPCGGVQADAAIGLWYLNPQVGALRKQQGSTHPVLTAGTEAGTALHHRGAELCWALLEKATV